MILYVVRFLNMKPKLKKDQHRFQTSLGVNSLTYFFEKNYFQTKFGYFAMDLTMDRNPGGHSIKFKIGMLIWTDFHLPEKITGPKFSNPKK